MTALGPEGPTDSDLACSLGNGCEHDIHDPDSPHDQRKSCDRSHDVIEHSGLLLGSPEEFDGGFDLYVFASGKTDQV